MFEDAIWCPASLRQVILSVWSLFISAMPHGWKSFPELPSADKSGKYSGRNDNYLRPLINTSSSAPGLRLVTANRAALGNAHRGAGLEESVRAGRTQSALLVVTYRLVLSGDSALVNASWRKEKDSVKNHNQTWTKVLFPDDMIENNVHFFKSRLQIDAL